MKRTYLTNLTKRKWRRIRGKIIVNNWQLSPLRRVRYSHFVMDELIWVFYFN